MNKFPLTESEMTAIESMWFSELPYDALVEDLAEWERQQREVAAEAGE